MDCKLPGSKPREGELPGTVMEKLVHSSELAPLAEAIQFTQTNEEIVCGVSERTAVTTKYMRTVYNAALSVPLEDLDLEATCVAGPTTVITQRSTVVCTVSSGEGMFGNSLSTLHRPRPSVAGGAAQHDPQVASHLHFDVFALADRSGKIHLYAWLAPAELEHFRTAQGKHALGELLVGVHVTAEVADTASKRMSVVIGGGGDAAEGGGPAGEGLQLTAMMEDVSTTL